MKDSLGKTVGAVSKPKKIVWLALNAKFPHTSLSCRYLREACRKTADTELLELTINHQLLDILGEIYEKQPAILGIACYIWNIELVKRLLRLLPKVLPHTIILCGGPEVSYETEKFLLEYPMVSYVVRGEGEEAVLHLMQHLLSGKSHDIDFSGIAWRDTHGIHAGEVAAVSDLSLLPFPYREEEISLLSERILYYETSRGCPFSCRYCLSCATQGVRYLPLLRVFSEIDFFVRHNVRQVKFVDRTFNAKKLHFLPILKHILDIPDTCRTNFHFEVAINYVDAEVCEVLGRMPEGRVQLEIGIQSTNPLTLASVARVNDWDRIAENIQKIRSFQNMHLHVDLIIGLPEEGMDSFAKSFQEVYALKPDMLQLGFLKFLKGAAMMELVEDGEYRYMDTAPYEVLGNRWLSYGEIRWLHSFEMVFELYYNAGRCRYTMDELMVRYEDGNVFRFYQKFTDFWEQRGYHRVAHATKSLYGYLAEFAAVQYGEDLGYLDNLLRFDSLMADKGRLRPDSLHWNRERYQAWTAKFWRGKEVLRYLPNFQFVNWRELRGSYHIEIFDYDVLQKEKKQTAVLFDFTGSRTVCMKIECPVDFLRKVLQENER